MQVSIDWFSFSLPVSQEPGTAFQAHEFAKHVLREHLGELFEVIYNGDTWDSRAGRAPYRYGMQRGDNGVMIFIGSNTGTMLVEMTGKGCRVLTGLASAAVFCERLGNRCTRIDIACDMPTDERPADFTNNRSKGHGMSIGFVRSATGETCYIGSQKSERYCRVYRYEEPHPRSHLLRFEAVYRRDYAKALCQAIADAHSYEQIAVTVGERYGWLSEAWNTGKAEALDLTLPRSVRHLNKTVSWLLTTCAPSLAKCLMEGAIEWEQFEQAVVKAWIRQ